LKDSPAAGVSASAPVVGVREEGPFGDE
jgi:hypothetical protein